jgi:7-cyano-7-deazaguanine synthase
MSKSAIVLVSGGMDSATAVYEAIEQGYEPYILHVSYGQRTVSKEHECAQMLAETVENDNVIHVQADHFAAIGASSLTDESIDVPDSELDSDTIPTTYVPFRNANLLAMAVSYAEASECGAIFIGAHSEDFSGYPDCRPAFFEAFQRVIDVGTKPDTDIALNAPFAEWSKTDIVERGIELGVPFEQTWSCYRDSSPACGTCDACAFRLEAFQQNGVRDPIEYAQRPTYVE